MQSPIDHTYHGSPSNDSRYHPNGLSGPNGPNGLIAPNGPNGPNGTRPNDHYHSGPASVAPDRPGIDNGGVWIENGRQYGTRKPFQYMGPVDDEELDRLDIFHKFFSITREYMGIGQLHAGSLPPDRPIRVLDLGCGTGIWCIDMAKAYPNAHVIGWDLNDTQPQPHTNIGNLRFDHLDFTEPKGRLEPNSMDLIHMRLLGGSVVDWPTLYQNIFTSLQPGTGLFEHVEIDFQPKCLDKSLPDDAKLHTWVRDLYAAHDRAGKPMMPHPDPRCLLNQAGFVDIQHQTFDLPFHPWRGSDPLRNIGRWFNLGMQHALEGMTMAPLTRVLDYSPEQVRQLNLEVKKEICTRSKHMSCTMHVWHARKPAASSPSDFSARAF